MKKIMVLWIVIVVAILAAGCATLALSPEERALLRDFNEVSFTADDIKVIEACGFNLKHLTPRQKVEIVKEWKGIQAGLMFYQ